MVKTEIFSCEDFDVTEENWSRFESEAEIKYSVKRELEETEDTGNGNKRRPRATTPDLFEDEKPPLSNSPNSIWVKIKPEPGLSSAEEKQDELLEFEDANNNNNDGDDEDPKTYPELAQAYPEDRKLINDLRIPLDNCDSNYVLLGLDPNLDFQPSISFREKNSEKSVEFSAASFRDFVRVLQEITARFSFQILEVLDLQEYLVIGNRMGSVRFVSKSSENYEFHLTIASLMMLQEVKSLVLDKVKFLEKQCGNLKFFCRDVAMEMMNTEGDVSNKVIMRVLDKKYRHDFSLCKTVFEFKSSVLKEVIRVEEYFRKFNKLE